jgi:DNA primase
MRPEQYNSIDTDDIKSGIDLVEFIYGYTKLKRVSAKGEYAGPCPRCGGEDRFHVKGDRFFCRQCYPRGGDIIDFVRIMHNLSFREACEYLQGVAAVPTEQDAAAYSSPEETTNHDETEFQTSARRTVYATHRLLMSEQGAPGQHYLLERGITEETWKDYQVGYGQVYHPRRRERMDTIFLPWYAPDGASIQAIQHRYIDDSIEKDERYTLKPGSTPTLFGLQVLQPADAVIVVEGEFNCMALHQLGVQTLSVGSQSNIRGGDALTTLTERLRGYETIVFWFDETEVTRQISEMLREIAPFREKEIVAFSHMRDANDLLVSGELSDVVEELTNTG